MTSSQLANVLEAIVVAGCFLVVFFGIVRTARLDSIRQKLFALRDEMFDYAASGGIGFDEPAYQLLRNQMNGFIRYAHQITLFRFLVSVGIEKTLGSRQKPTWGASWEESLLSLESDRVRSQMNAYHERAIQIVVRHLISGSLLLFAATLLAMLGISIKQAGHASYSGYRQLARFASRRVMVGVLDPRLLEEEAACA